MGCDAETAFNELKRISQTRHVKLTALARRIVEGSRPGGDGGPSGLAGAAGGR
jgi:hypothetical protein